MGKLTTRQDHWALGAAAGEGWGEGRARQSTGLYLHIMTQGGGGWGPKGLGMEE